MHECYGQIRDARPELQRRRLRLIHSGRLLTDGTYIYSWLTSLEDKQRRAVREVTTEEVQSASQTLTWLHCSVGPELTQEEEEEENLTQVRILKLHCLCYCCAFTLNYRHRRPKSNL